MLLAFPVALAGLALAAERFKFTHIDLTPYLNNKAAAPTGQLAGFNDGKEAYPVEFLPTGIIHDGGFSVRYDLPAGSHSLLISRAIVPAPRLQLRSS